MRIYSASSEDALRARRLLAEWAGEGFLTKSQHQRLVKETVSELRTTNIFLRVILFLFTLVCVGAATALFFRVFLWHAPDKTTGVFLLAFAAVCYAGAEVSASQARLYRHGIEEALAACSVGFLCSGMLLAFFSGAPYSSTPRQSESLVLIAGAIFSLWIWHRFGLWYAFLAAMIFALFLPGYWTSSHSAQHVSVALLYVIGLICVTAAHSRSSDYLDDDYSLPEALLWLGIYLAINLQLSSLDVRMNWWGFGNAASQFPRSFYWGTWVLIWLLPVLVLVRGVRRKYRFVIAVGAIEAILTFVTNKPYLGWSRHTWDPMLLGILLTAVVLFIRRWLAAGPEGIRHGFTAARLTGRDKHWLNAGSVVLGLVTPQALTSTPQTRPAEFHFDGGSSGGGGASGDF